MSPVLGTFSDERDRAGLAEVAIPVRLEVQLDRGELGRRLDRPAASLGRDRTARASGAGVRGLICAALVSAALVSAALVSAALVSAAFAIATAFEPAAEPRSRERPTARSPGVDPARCGRARAGAVAASWSRCRVAGRRGRPMPAPSRARRDSAAENPPPWPAPRFRPAAALRCLPPRWPPPGRHHIAIATSDLGVTPPRTRPRQRAMIRRPARCRSRAKRREKRRESCERRLFRFVAR